MPPLVILKWPLATVYVVFCVMGGNVELSWLSDVLALLAACFYVVVGSFEGDSGGPAWVWNFSRLLGVS